MYHNVLKSAPCLAVPPRQKNKNCQAIYQLPRLIKRFFASSTALFKAIFHMMFSNCLERTADHGRLPRNHEKHTYAHTMTYHDSKTWSSITWYHMVSHTKFLGSQTPKNGTLCCSSPRAKEILLKTAKQFINSQDWPNACLPVTWH